MLRLIERDVLRGLGNVEGLHDLRPYLFNAGGWLEGPTASIRRGFRDQPDIGAEGAAGGQMAIAQETGLRPRTVVHACSTVRAASELQSIPYKSRRQASPRAAIDLLHPCDHGRRDGGGKSGPSPRLG